MDSSTIIAIKRAVIDVTDQFRLKFRLDSEAWEIKQKNYYVSFTDEPQERFLLFYSPSLAAKYEPRKKNAISISDFDQ